MRNCPHCNNEIQDEAILCRFCRKDVDPPLWMTSLVKCPFCAEWIERGIDRCPLCGKAISAEQPFSVEIETDNQAEDFLDRLRRSELPDIDDEQAEPFEEPLEEPVEKPIEVSALESDSEPLDEAPIFERTEIKIESEPVVADRKIRRTPSQPTDEGIAVLHSRRLDDVGDFERRREPETEPEEEQPSALATFLEGPLPRWIAIGVGFIAIAVIAVLLYPRVREALRTLATPSAIAGIIGEDPSPTPTHDIATDAVEVTPGVGVLLPTPMPTTRSCYAWDEITLDMAGQTVCAFGAIKRWFRVDDIPYVAIFSEQAGTFAIIDRGLTYPEYTPGTCITTRGEVEIMRGTRPFIEANGDLETCE